jgi:membrane protein involved in colicin uptake
MESATPSVEPTAASPTESAATATSAETAAAESPAAAEASDASTTDVVGVCNGPGSAASGSVARMVSRPEVSTVANTAVAVATISEPVAKVRSSIRIPW